MVSASCLSYAPLRATDIIKAKVKAEFIFSLGGFSGPESFPIPSFLPVAVLPSS